MRQSEFMTYLLYAHNQQPDVEGHAQLGARRGRIGELLIHLAHRAGDGIHPTMLENEPRLGHKHCRASFPSQRWLHGGAGVPAAAHRAVARPAWPICSVACKSRCKVLQSVKC